MLRGLSLLLQEAMPSSITLLHCSVLTAEKLIPFLHKSLTHLDLRGSSLESIPPEIVKCPLKELYLTGCETMASFEERGSLGNTPKLPSLKNFHIDSCPQLASVPLDALSLKEFKANQNPKLAEVILRGNVFTEIDLRESPLVNLEELFVNSHPEFSMDLGPGFYAILGGYVDGLLKNKVPNQKQQRLGEGLLIFLKKALKGRDFEPHDLTDTLGIRNLEIGNGEVKALAAALPSSQVTRLELNDNKIGEEGAIALAAALPNSQVTTLNLRYNSIGEEGARALAAALPNSQVTTLDLWGTPSAMRGQGPLPQPCQTLK